MLPVALVALLAAGVQEESFERELKRTPAVAPADAAGPFRVAPG